MLQQLALVAVLVQAAAISRTAGHGNIIVPKPTGNAEHPYYIGGPAGTIDQAEIIGDTSYGEYYQAVDDWFTKNNIASLKEYITTYGSDISECGNTEKDGTPQPVPSDGYAQHDTLGNSHPGPCEIWCDDTRVFHDTNCVDKFSGQSPAKIPIDVSVCEASSEFVFYWLALHAQPWQVYINCVALDGTAAASSGSTNSTSTSQTTTAPTASTTKTPTVVSVDSSVDNEASAEEEATETPTTPTVVSVDSSVDNEASAEEEATEAPATPATDAPAAITAPSSKCNVRHRK